MTATLAMTLVYGSSEASADTTSTPKPSGRAGLTSYQLAPGLLKTTNSPPGNPTQVHGVLGMPKGKGPHPVVVVMHGSHHNCAYSDKPPYFPRKPVKAQWPLVCAKPGDAGNPNLGPDYLRHDVGLSHVVQALTRKGFVAVSIDVVSPETWWSGETHPEKGYTELINAHLRLLSDLNRGVNHGLNIPGVQGRIDTSRVGLVGHSRAGGYVLSPKAAKRAGLFGAVALEPAAGAEKPTHKVPVLNVRGGCDEDVQPSAGLEEMKDLATSGSTKVAADVLLAGTGHRMLNTNLPPTDHEGGRGRGLSGLQGRRTGGSPGPGRSDHRFLPGPGAARSEVLPAPGTQWPRPQGGQSAQGRPGRHLPPGPATDLHRPSCDPRGHLEAATAAGDSEGPEGEQNTGS
ncbi:hypothetical protein [Streptomyces sp. NPDC015125]|uniref:hypothetical protein n=1 Tax=Streptomyces sp. NPDC015125 TaxID=3364938 RepID=UPI0036F79D59